MKFDYIIEAESEEEKELIDAVANARDEALSEDVSVSMVQKVLLLFAMQIGGNNHTEDKTPQKSVCPVCGESVSDYESQGIGEDIILIPCGCSVAIDELSESLQQEIIF